MTRFHETKHRLVTTFQRHIANPVTRRLPTQVLLETTGRTSGLARRTPVGGRRVGGAFWLVSEFGFKSQYVRNIQADPASASACAATGTAAPRTCCPRTTPAPAWGSCRASTAPPSAASASTC